LLAIAAYRKPYAQLCVKAFFLTHNLECQSTELGL
jgi:hypothetical protein